MLLKRKRSNDSPFALPSPSPSPYSKAPPSSTSLAPSRPIVNSRTQKRHRDNRPSEETIYAQTLHKLYDAQRTQSQQNNGIGQQARQGEDGGLDVSRRTMTQKQKSLHSFWSLPSSSAAGVEGQMSDAGSVVDDGEDRCEDCDAPMRLISMETDGDYTMSDTSMGLEVQAHLGGGSCAGCGRRVCGLCSLVPRERRICLECVGRGWV